MPITKIVDIRDTTAYDHYVGPPLKTSSHANVREGSSWAAGFMRHHGQADWRDIQAWRYLGAVVRKLLTDPAARRHAKMMQGKILAAKGEQSVRCARILARVIDESGILEADEDAPNWFTGYADGFRGRDRHKDATALYLYTDGFVAGRMFTALRHTICGLPPNWEDPAGEADDEYHHA